MGTIGKQLKPMRSFKNGVDNTTPLEDPNIQETLSACLNGEMVDSNLITTRPGISPITNTSSNRIIRQGVEYNKSDGTREQIVYTESTTLTGSSGLLGRITGPTIATITSGLPDGIKPCMVQAGSLLFVFTGISDFVYDGSTTRQIGIDAPNDSPTYIGAIPGDKNSSSYYSFVYVYRNSITGATSSPSLPSSSMSTSTTTTGNNGIKIGITPGNSSTADTIDIYSTAGGGGIYFYDGSVPISSTTYSSTVTDAGLGNQLELDNSRLPESATMAVLIDNRLFVAGFRSNKSRIQYSKIGINGPMYESFQIADICDCNPDDGQEIVGVGKLGTKIGVLKNNRVGKLISTDISTGGLETGGSQKYIYKEIDDDCTATSFHTIFTLDDFMGWLGRDNCYITDGFTAKPIADRIRTTIRTLNFNNSYKFETHKITYPHQVVISVVRSGQSECDYQLVLHFKDFPNNVAWTMFGPGPDTSTHPGMPIGCMWASTVNGIEQPYAGSCNGNGKIYQYGNSTNDDGYPIYFSVKGQWECGQDAMNRKSFQSVKYLATTGAAIPNNILINTWEENGTENIVKTETAIIETITKWNTKHWNTFKWSGKVFSPIMFFPNRKAFVGRFGCYNDKLDAPVAIKTMRLMYRPTQE